MPEGQGAIADAGCSHAVASRAKLNDASLMMPPRWAIELAGADTDRQRTLAPGETVSSGASATLVSVRVAGAAGLDRDALQRASADAVRGALSAISASPHPRVVRMWSFVPGIHRSMGGTLDRYQVFNAGRYGAFEEWCGGATAFSRELPAATCVGTFGEDLLVHALGATEPGVAVNNPRQVPAFQYSRAYGPKPPCFARATVARFGSEERLLIAGTASVRGERSVFPCDLEAQVDETFRNIGVLLQGASGVRAWSPLAARVYAPVERDLAWLRGEVARRWPGVNELEFVRADICRADLMVEIELIARRAERA